MNSQYYLDKKTHQGDICLNLLSSAVLTLCGAIVELLIRCKDLCADLLSKPSMA